MLQIPVSPTLMGKGAIPEDHPLWAGMVGIQTSQRYAQPARSWRATWCSPSARASATATPATSTSTAATARSSTSTSRRSRSAGSSRPTWASSGDAKLALRALVDQARERRRRPRGPGVDARRAELKGTLARRDGLRRRADQAAAGLPGDQRVLRPGHHLRDRDRPVPDLERAVPAHLQAAPLPVLRPGRPARAGRSRRASGSSSPRPTSTWSASSATTRSSS